MKNIFFLSFLVFLPLTASAANFQAGETLQVKTEGNAYAAGNLIQVPTEVKGDVFLAGETIQINARITEDAFLAGRTITINADIDDDLHAFGETIIVNRAIKGDLMAFGAKVVISPESTVGGQTIIGAEQIMADGRFEQSVKLMGTDIELHGVYLGDVELQVHDTYRIAEDAEIRGNLHLIVAEGMNMVVPEGVVRGTVQREMQVNTKSEKRFLPFAGAISFFSILSRIAVGMILIAFSRVFAIKFGKGLERGKNIGRTLGIGSLMLILPPIIGVLLFIPIITLPLALIMIVGWAALLYLGALLSGLLIANVFFPLNETDSYFALSGKFILGTILASLIHIVPFIGFFLGFFVFLLSLGCFFLYKRNTWRHLRKAHLI